MKLLYNKIFKNYQVNLGMPFQVRMPVSLQTLKTHNMQIQTSNEEYEDTIDHNHVNPSVVAEEILQRAGEEADLILKEAHLEANRIFENAKKDAKELGVAAEEEGKRQGYEQGYNEAMHQYEDLIKQAQDMKESSIFEYNQVLAGIETDAVELILDIAKKVIGEEISINKENILYLVKQGFEKCTNNENSIIKVSPEDFDYLIGNKDKLIEMVEGIGDIEVKKEASLKAGACLIETPFGSVDAGAQTKLRKIEEAFKQLTGK